MRAARHIKRLTNWYGKTRDELALMVQEGHIHKSFISLHRLEEEWADLLKDIEKADFAKPYGQSQ